MNKRSEKLRSDTGLFDRMIMQLKGSCIIAVVAARDSRPSAKLPSGSEDWPWNGPVRGETDGVGQGGLSLDGTRWWEEAGREFYRG